MTDMNKIEELVQIELAEANEIHPPFADDAHAYVVMLEEYEECKEQLERCQRQMGHIWELVRKDENPHAYFVFTKQAAEELAREAIQLAAMCDKAM